MFSGECESVSIITKAKNENLQFGTGGPRCSCCIPEHLGLRKKARTRYNLSRIRKENKTPRTKRFWSDK